MPDVTYDNQNIFAKVLHDGPPCIKVYEGDRTIALMDIIPQTDGHALVLPKEGAVELFGLSDDVISAAIHITRKLARIAWAAFAPPGTATSQLDGSAAGQTMPHVYSHALPRYSDTPLQPHARVQASGDKLKARAKKIIAVL